MANIAQDTVEQKEQDTVEQQEQDAVEQAETKTPNETPDIKSVLSNKEVQAEIDRRITKAIATAKEKWDREATMTDEQRAESQLTQKEQELEERQRALDLRELKSEVSDNLRKQGLPLAFAELIAQSSDKESHASVVAEIKKAWDAQIAEQLKANARQATPKAGYTPPQEQDDEERNLGAFAQKIRKVK